MTLLKLRDIGTSHLAPINARAARARGRGLDHAPAPADQG